MAIRRIEQLKKWFSRGKYPTEEQFADWLDSYVHKEDHISIEKVDKLSELLNNKFDRQTAEELESNFAELQSTVKDIGERIYDMTPEKIVIESYKEDGEVVFGSDIQDIVNAAMRASDGTVFVVIDELGSSVANVWVENDITKLFFTGSDGRRHEISFWLGIDGYEFRQRAYRDEDFLTTKNYMDEIDYPEI